MFNYSVNVGEKLTIKTPNVKSLSDIKIEHKQTADCIINHSVYPDGTDVTFSQLCNKIIISSNKELIKNDNRVINAKNFNTNDLIKIADYVITDYSSLMIDTLVANKKLLLYVYDYNTYTKNNGLNINLLKDYPNITKVNGKDINNILKKDQYDLGEYQRFYNKYNPNLKNCTKKIVKLIKENLL